MNGLTWNKALIAAIGTATMNYIDKVLAANFADFYQNWWAPGHDLEALVFGAIVGYLVYKIPNAKE